MNSKFGSLLACPKCHAAIISEWKCAEGHVYPESNGAPCFSIDLTDGTKREIEAAHRSFSKTGGFRGAEQEMGSNWSVEYGSILEDIAKAAGNRNLVFVELGLGPEYLSYNLATRRPSSLIIGTDVVTLPETPWGGPLENYFRLECAMQSLPFKDASVDIIFLKSALHHAENLPRTFSEIRRVLKDDGAMLAFNEITRSLFEKSDHSDAHRNGYNDQSYSVSDYRHAAALSGLTMKLCFPAHLERFFSSPPKSEFSGRKTKIVVLKLIKKAHLVWLVRLVFPLIPYLFIVPVKIVFQPSERTGVSRSSK